MGHSAVSPRSQILKDGPIFMVAAQNSPANGLGKSTSVEFIYDEYTVLQSLENSLCLSAALDSFSLIAVHDAHRFSSRNASPQASAQWTKRRQAGDSYTNSMTLSANSASFKPPDVLPGRNLAPDWC